MKKALRVALVGNPNCGKTSLFNQLTGTKQKVANYAGVTVERKEGFFNLPQGQPVRLLDLPGTYSLNAASPDEAITRDVCRGVIADESQDLFLCVLDATNLKLHFNLLLEMIELNQPLIVVLNMMDEARRRGITVHAAELSRALGVPVVECVAKTAQGVEHVVQALEQGAARPHFVKGQTASDDVRRLYHLAVSGSLQEDDRTARLDQIFLHPIWGLVTLAVMMFVVFQGVFAWAAPFMDMIDGTFTWISQQISPYIQSALLHSLIIDGLIAGAGSVVIFLPQILILFFFILLLEESGYLPRAAFLLDRLMFQAGLSGRAFIPLLSSFACAVPGIMATRSISDPRDRLTTILVAPLMTCSARLPVYALLIAAFIPSTLVWGIFNLQGLVLFALYMAGIVSALIVSFVIKWWRKDRSEHSLMMELPNYHLPNLKSVALGVFERAKIFLKRVGGIIFALSILLWLLSTFPQPPVNATAPAINYSFAGQLGQLIQPLFAPIGFPWQICVALIPAMAAREVAVAALGTVYAISGTDDAQMQSLVSIISDPQGGWSIATGLSLLVWFIYAPHCLSTLATIRRETGSWQVVTVATVYLFGLAYMMSFFTYQIAIRWL